MYGAIKAIIDDYTKKHHPLRTSIRAVWNKADELLYHNPQVKNPPLELRVDCQGIHIGHLLKPLFAKEMASFFATSPAGDLMPNGITISMESPTLLVVHLDSECPIDVEDELGVFFVDYDGDDVLVDSRILD